MAKAIKSFIISMLLGIFSLAAQNNQELFLQANQEYGQGNNAQALQLYESISNKGSAAWYNMGNCCYNLDRPTEALLYWKRAEKGADAALRKAVHHNIDILKKKAALENEKLSMQAKAQLFIEEHAARGSLLRWQWFFLIVWFVFVLIGPFAVSWRRRALFFASYSLLFIACTSLLIAKHSTSTRVSAIAKDDILLYVGPDIRFASHGSVKKMQELYVDEQIGEWCKISAQNKKGWVPYDAIMCI
jgi:tetratricopeptide (TPR) repeat protein